MRQLSFISLFWMAVVANNVGFVVEARIGSHKKYHAVAETESASNGRLIVIMADDFAGSLSESVPSFLESKYMVSRVEYALNGYIVENVPERVLEEILDSKDVRASCWGNFSKHIYYIEFGVLCLIRSDPRANHPFHKY